LLQEKGRKAKSKGRRRGGGRGALRRDFEREDFEARSREEAVGRLQRDGKGQIERREGWAWREGEWEACLGGNKDEIL